MIRWEKYPAMRPGTRIPGTELRSSDGRWAIAKATVHNGYLLFEGGEKVATFVRLKDAKNEAETRL